MVITESDARSLVVSAAESVALHRFLGLMDGVTPLGGPELARAGLELLLRRGIVRRSEERYEVSKDVAVLLSAYDDPEWSTTWMSFRPAGPTILTGSVGEQGAKIRVGESDGRQAFSWTQPGNVLSVVYEACDIEGYARPDGETVVVSEQDVLDQFNESGFDPDTTTFEYAGREMVEVLSVAIECRRRGVAVRSFWVKGADKSFWRYRDIDGAEFGGIEPADPNDLWQWLNSGQHAVQHELEPPDGFNNQE